MECVETQIGNRNSKQQAQDNKIYEICILFPNLNPFADARNGKYNNIQKRYYVPLKLIWQLIAAATKCICARITPSKVHRDSRPRTGDFELNRRPRLMAVIIRYIAGIARICLSLSGGIEASYRLTSTSNAHA